MPLYDYQCKGCGREVEKSAPMAERHNQTCDVCHDELEILFKPTPRYKPFNGYFDEGLGVEVTGRQHRQRVMRDLGMDFRDHPSKGDLNARKDKCNEVRKREISAGLRDRRTGAPLR